MEQLFADDAVELLTQATQGVPRLLNQAGHQALLLAREAGSDLVDVEAAHGALEMLGLMGDDETGVDGSEIPEESQNPGELLPLNGGDESLLEEMPGIAPRRFVAPALD